jgi:hypothetical protein
MNLGDGQFCGFVIKSEARSLERTQFSVKTLDLQVNKISDFYTCWRIREVVLYGNHPSPGL